MNATRILSVLSLSLSVAACSSSTSPVAGSDDAGGSSSGGSSSGGSSSGSSSSGSSSSGGSSGGSSGSSSGSSSGGGISDAGGADAGGGAGIPANDAKLVIHIPAGFTGTTRELDVALYTSLPVAGPPSYTLHTAQNPVLTAGEALTIHGDDTGIKGSYYVVVVLYMQGGGVFVPTPGIDYSAQSASAFAFNGASTDLGSISLTLATDGGT